MDEIKKELNSYQYDIKLLKEKEEELEELITKAEKITTELSDMPKGTPQIQDKIAEYTAKIIELKNQKIDQIIEMYKQKEMIEKKIDLLEQPYKDILYYKYIKGYTLTQIANEINYDSDYIKSLHGTALLKYKIIPNLTESHHKNMI